jgi:hypothetical protein
MINPYGKPKATENFEVAQAKRNFLIAISYLDDVEESSEKIECIRGFIKELKAMKKKHLKGEQ